MNGDGYYWYDEVCLPFLRTMVIKTTEPNDNTCCNPDTTPSTRKWFGWRYRRRQEGTTAAAGEANFV